MWWLNVGCVVPSSRAAWRRLPRRATRWKQIRAFNSTIDVFYHEMPCHRYSTAVGWPRTFLKLQWEAPHDTCIAKVTSLKPSIMALVCIERRGRRARRRASGRYRIRRYDTCRRGSLRLSLPRVRPGHGMGTPLRARPLPGTGTRRENRCGSSGYRSQPARRTKLTSRNDAPDPDSQIDRGQLLLGSPATVLSQIERIQSRIKPGVLDLHFPDLDRDAIMRAVELLGREVVPAVHAL